MRIEVDGVDLTDPAEVAMRSAADELRDRIMRRYGYRATWWMECDVDVTGSDDPSLSPDAARWTPEDDG